MVEVALVGGGEALSATGAAEDGEERVEDGYAEDDGKCDGYGG